MTHLTHDFDHIIPDLSWVREVPADYHLDDPDPGYDVLSRRPPLGPLAILWGEGKLAYVLEDGEVVERHDGS